ncbi:unnamed protein product [Acidocella sp. C78]|nr:unnamed protein product [Acidocella sp. C78]
MIGSFHQLRQFRVLGPRSARPSRSVGSKTSHGAHGADYARFTRIQQTGYNTPTPRSSRPCH